jgi:biotin carboxyl carrier protein
MAYIVSVGNRSHRIEVLKANNRSTDSVLDLLVDGTSVQVSAVEVADPSHLSVIIDHRSYDVVFEEDIVSVEGVSFAVEVEDELKKRLAEAMKKSGLQETGTEIKAPMPGLVVAVEISAGQKVSSGQGLIVLEAMKMQNELRAPRDGIVKAVFVEQGAKVAGGDLLAAIE